MARFGVFLFWVFLLHHHHQRVTSDFSKEENQALILFRQKVTLRTDYQDSWKDSEQVCNWKGVYCDATNSSVIRLRIPGAVAGQIPPDTIGKLVSLRVLSLRLNRLYGPIPHDFSDLVVLTHLVLYNNNFSGQLPDMKSLKVLNVSNNNFSGYIPPSLSKFPHTVFSGNLDLCGDPLPACPGGTPTPPPPPPENPKKRSLDKRVIVGISVGSSLLLFILLCCLRRKINRKSKQPQKLPLQRSRPSTTSTTTEVDQRNVKLVFFSSSGINYSFDLEDLYRASPEVLGKGSVGTSYKYKVRDGGTTVVVKRLNDMVVTKDKFESTMEVLGKMKHKHVAPLVAYYYSKHEKLLVYDYMPAGSLFAHLHGSRGLGRTRLDWDDRMKIAVSAGRGVAYLHVEGKVVHGNIKSSNILFRQETTKDASVSDYGLNPLFGGLTSQVTGYQAPEVLKSREVTFESDVYSFGVLLLELLTGKDPNRTSLGKEGIEFPMWIQSIVLGEPKTEVFDVSLTKRHQNIEQEMVQLLQIAKGCVLFEPDQRPTMDEVVRMMEDMKRLEPVDERLIQSSDDHSKAFDDTPSTDTRDTPSTVTP